MAECKDIDKALQDLGRKIDNYNKRLNNLDNRLKKAEKCCDDKGNENLADILKRLSLLESAVNRILSYIESLESAIKASLNPLKTIVNLLNIF